MTLQEPSLNDACGELAVAILESDYRDLLRRSDVVADGTGCARADHASVGHQYRRSR